MLAFGFRAGLLRLFAIGGVGLRAKTAAQQGSRATAGFDATRSKAATMTNSSPQPSMRVTVFHGVSVDLQDDPPFLNRSDEVTAQDAWDAAAEAWPTAAPDRGVPPGPRVGAGGGPADGPELVALIGQVMAQDEAALVALYGRLSRQVHAVALRLTRQAALAEEVLQDTFWQVWRQAPRFDPARGSARAWVMTIARSRALDALRRGKGDPLLSLGRVEVEAVEADVGMGVDPLDLLGDARRNLQLHNAVAGLPPLKRQLIALAFHRGLTHEEISAQLCMPLGSVKSQFRRSLASLREALGDDFNPRSNGAAVTRI